MEDLIYRLVEEGNPNDGACFRITSKTCFDKHFRGEEYVKVEHVAGWDDISQFRRAVQEFASTQGLIRNRFKNGYDSGNGNSAVNSCRLEETDFFEAVSGVREN